VRGRSGKRIFRIRERWDRLRRAAAARSFALTPASTRAARSLGTERLTAGMVESLGDAIGSQSCDRKQMEATRLQMPVVANLPCRASGSSSRPAIQRFVVAGEEPAASTFARGASQPLPLSRYHDELLFAGPARPLLPIDLRRSRAPVRAVWLQFDGSPSRPLCLMLSGPAGSVKEN